MKKKQFTLFLAVCAAMCLCFGLAACGEKEHSHTYATEWTSDATYHWHACTASGECNAKEKDKAEHTFKNGVCTVCGYDNSTGNGSTPAHIHNMVKYDAVAATCISTGNIEYYSCSDCGKYFSDADGKNEIAKSSVTIAKTDHAYSHYECTECGTTLQTTKSGLTYELNEDGNGYVVTGWTFGSLTATTLVIPETYQNLPVTEIGERALYHNSSEGTKSAPLLNITKLYLPDSLEKIGDYAFYDLEGLAYLNLGNGVTYIGVGAFSFCDALTELVIPDCVITIEDSAFYAYAFSNSALENVTIGSGVTYIGSEAFGNQKNLTGVIFKDPNGWTRWGLNSKAGTSVSSDKMADPEKAAELLLGSTDYWKKA